MYIGGRTADASNYTSAWMTRRRSFLSVTADDRHFKSIDPDASSRPAVLFVSDVTMHVSDVLLECSKECARLSRQCRDKQIADALFDMSARLLCAATHDAELAVDDVQATSQPDLYLGIFRGE
jgi:hypothetical protein